MFPILFHIYGFEVHSYPVIIIAGVLISSYVFAKLCFRKQLVLDFLSDFFLIITLTTFLFARLGGILESYSLYLQEPLRIFNVFDGAYNFYAALFGFMVTFFLISQRKKEKFWKWMDTLSLPFLLFLSLLSLADFFAGKNYGIPSSLPWAVSFNIPEVRYTIPIHPIQIYESFLLFLSIIFLKFSLKHKHYDGVITSYTLLSVFGIHAILSLLRGAPETVIFDMRLSLILSVLGFLGALVLLVFRTHPNIHLFHYE